MHGFALNVNTDLKYFTYIIPCSIIDKGATSVSKLLGQKVEMQRVKEYVLRSFSEVFGVSLEEGSRIDKCLALGNIPNG